MFFHHFFFKDFLLFVFVGMNVFKTFNSAVLVGVAPDSFLIYLSPLSPAEKLLCIVVVVVVASDKLRVKMLWGGEEKDGMEQG